MKNTNNKQRGFLTLGAALAVASLTAGTAVAEIVPGAPFAHGMVLQRNMKVPVWGTAAAGEKITVSFAGQTKTATADAKGAWRVDLDPMPASKESRTLKFSTSASTPSTLSLTNIVVGEVWFASGQSNMECPIWGDKPHYRDRNGVMLLQRWHHPYVRFASARGYPNWIYKWNVAPQSRPISPVQWFTLEPKSFKNYTFSAVALYYALELYHALEIPVGIVGAYHGGTRIEPWIPRSGIESVDKLKEMQAWKVVTQEEWKPEFAKQCPRGAAQQPTVLFNTMVAPWTPMAIRGFIWYQGCSGGGPGEYDDLMHALYNGWAKEFENPSLKLYVAQICCNGGGGVKELQAKFAAEEPNAEIAILADLGNPDDIHPNDKQTVAQRLVLHALKHDYGYNDIEADSPVVKTTKVEGATVVLEMEHARKLYVYNATGGYAAPFEIAGADGRFKPAKIVNITDYRRDKTKGEPRTLGTIDEPRLVIQAEGVTVPAKIRYLYQKPWHSSVYNQVALPLGSFYLEVK